MDGKMSTNGLESQTQAIDLNDNESDDIVNPWTVTSTSEKGINYDLLIKKFGCSKIDGELLDRFRTVTGHEPHFYLKRGIFFAHRDLEKILDLYEARKPFYLYTGRGPSSDSMHIGHILPFVFAKWLQHVFNVPLVIQFTDDEKFLWKDLDLKQLEKMTCNNIKDVIAFGFDPKNTFIFSNFQFLESGKASHFYKNVFRIHKCINVNQIKKIFGLTDDDNPGKLSYPSFQIAPSLASSFPFVFGSLKTPASCLIPCGIDQDPFFRLNRDIAHRLAHPKPSLVLSSFLPSLQGHKSKMSASDPKSSISLTDTPNQIKNKINKYAFSGGRETIEEHRKLGGNCDIDISYQYLRYFLEDDEQLDEIRQKYASGEMLTGELKKMLIDVVTKIVLEHQKSKAAIADADLELFRTPRNLQAFYF